MDKSWINAPRNSNAYKVGCESFVKFASTVEFQGTILCPCLKCCNDKRLSSKEVLRHILFGGFCPGYTTWTLHGEHVSSSQYDTPYITKLASKTTNVLNNPHSDTSNIKDMIYAALGVNSGGDPNGEIGESGGSYGAEDVDGVNADVPSNAQNLPRIDTPRYQKVLDECEKELYPGCKYSQLSFNLHLYHIKCMGGLSNKIFTMLLEFLRDVFPFLTSLPSSAYEAKKLCNDLGLGYQKIHACPNDCMLYWGERVDQESCHVCHSSRWKGEEKDNDEDEGTSELDECSNISKKKKPAKVLRYFPLIPRLKRIYASPKTAKDMRWHEMDRTKDGLLRHPADGLAWKDFNDRYPEFAVDPRSVRLGLASDEFNPF